MRDFFSFEFYSSNEWSTDPGIEKSVKYVEYYMYIYIFFSFEFYSSNEWSTDPGIEKSVKYVEYYMYIYIF